MTAGIRILLEMLPWLCGLASFIIGGAMAGSPYPTKAIALYALNLVIFALAYLVGAAVPCICGMCAAFPYFLIVQLMKVPDDLLDFKKYVFLVPLAMALWNIIGYKIGEQLPRAWMWCRWLITFVLALSANVIAGFISGYSKHYPGTKYALYLLGSTLMYVFAVFGLMRTFELAIRRFSETGDAYDYSEEKNSDTDDEYSE